MAKKTYIGRQVRKQVHMSICVEGVLKWARKINFMTDKSGRPLSDQEARDRLKMYRYEGKRVIPTSSECYRFDYQEGCPGHTISIKPNEELMEEIENEYTAYLIARGEACFECGKEMTDTDTNYGTPEMAVCLSCHAENVQFKI